MRVRANKDLTFFYGMVPYTVAAGQIVDSAGARHLLDTGADVTVLDEEPVDVETAPVVAGVDLDITGKIADVLAWVGDDEDRAVTAHAAEEAKGDKARSRLLAQLEEIAAGSPAPVDDDAGVDEGDDDEAETTED